MSFLLDPWSPLLNYVRICTWNYLLHFPLFQPTCCKSSLISIHLSKISHISKFVSQVLGVLSRLCWRMKAPLWTMMAFSHFLVILTVQRRFDKKYEFFLDHKQIYDTHQQLTLYCHRLKFEFPSCIRLPIQLCGRVWQLHETRFLQWWFFFWD